MTDPWSALLFFPSIFIARKGRARLAAVGALHWYVPNAGVFRVGSLGGLCVDDSHWALRSPLMPLA